MFLGHTLPLNHTFPTLIEIAVVEDVSLHYSTGPRGLGISNALRRLTTPIRWRFSVPFALSDSPRGAVSAPSPGMHCNSASVQFKVYFCRGSLLLFTTEFG